MCYNDVPKVSVLWGNGLVRASMARYPSGLFFLRKYAAGGSRDREIALQDAYGAAPCNV